jgi:ABC-2 type transport system permease protein
MTITDPPGTRSGDDGTEPTTPPVTSTYHRSTDLLRVVSPKISLRQRLVALWRYRELLTTMTRKELRVQYKDSVLGFVWSLITPATTMLVYYFVFQIVLGNNVPRFAIYLMSGVIVWTFFSSAVPAATGSVVGNSSIIKKVSFPREIPALAQVGSNLVQMGYQSAVLFGFMLAFRRGPAIEYLPLLIPAMVALVLMTSAFGVLLAAVNVKYRDTQHLLNVALTVWMWATPIVYEYRLISDKIAQHMSLEPLFILYRLNPMTPITLTFQRIFYASTSPPGKGGVPVHILPDHAAPWWYLWQLLLVIGFSLVLLTYALRVFGRMEGDFAEEL